MNVFYDVSKHMRFCNCREVCVLGLFRPTIVIPEHVVNYDVASPFVASVLSRHFFFGGGIPLRVKNFSTRLSGITIN